MEFLDLAKRRASVRAYQKRSVERDVLEQVLEAGRVAPTACNRQPVHLLVAHTPESMSKVCSAANLHGATAAIVVCAARDQAWVRSHDGFNAADTDAAIITDHMMLQAEALGLGSVWICYFDPDRLRRELQIPDGLEPVDILALGYSAQEAASPERHKNLRIPMEQLAEFI